MFLCATPLSCCCIKNVKSSPVGSGNGHGSNVTISPRSRRSSKVAIDVSNNWPQLRANERRAERDGVCHDRARLQLIHVSLGGDVCAIAAVAVRVRGQHV